MKILITIPCLGFGGTESQTMNLIKALKSDGHDVRLVCFFEYEHSILEIFTLVADKVELLRLERQISVIKLILFLKGYVKKINPDVIHVQYITPGALPIIAARLAGVKTVFATIHQPYSLTHSRISKIILLTVSLLTTRFISVSQNAEKSWFGKSFMYDKNKSFRIQSRHFTIYNSVDSERINQIASCVDIKAMKAKLKIPSGVLLIGAVSRLSHEKGIDMLIEALRLLKIDNIGFHLLIVGSGPEETKLMNQVSSYNLSHIVTFYGAADWETAMQLMVILDIVVVPSRFEGFGLTAAEAMTASKPVVASDSFGLKEIVIHEETGLVFQAGNTFDLSEKLKVLLSDVQLRELYGKSGYERVKKLFDMKVFQETISALYHSI